MKRPSRRRSLLRWTLGLVCSSKIMDTPVQDVRYQDTCGGCLAGNSDSHRFSYHWTREQDNLNPSVVIGTLLQEQPFSCSAAAGVVGNGW